MALKLKPQLVFALAWLCWLVPAPSRAPAEAGAGADAEAACIRQANIVYEAIRAFQAREGRLPDKLDELVPTYLLDASLLVCPVSKRTGDFSSGRDGFYDTYAVDLRPTYIYEFLAEPAKDADLDQLSRREFKNLARRTPIGDRVPIFTCLKHLEGRQNRINMGYDGSVYLSHEYWECAFNDLIPFSYLSPTLLQQHQSPPSERVPARHLCAPDRCLDLTGTYNALLPDPWLSGGGNKDLKPFAHEFPSGLCRLGGIPFDARALVQLGARIVGEDEEGFGVPTFPDTASPIKVGKVAGGLHFLHATAFPSPPGSLVGTYTIDYEDCTIPPESIPLRMGLETDLWRSDDPPALPPAWEEPGQPEHTRRLFTYHWTNPHPGAAIRSITPATNPDKAGAPFLLAVTLD